MHWNGTGEYPHSIDNVIGYLVYMQMLYIVISTQWLHLNIQLRQRITWSVCLRMNLWKSSTNILQNSFNSSGTPDLISNSHIGLTVVADEHHFWYTLSRQYIVHIYNISYVLKADQQNIMLPSLIQPIIRQLICSAVNISVEIPRKYDSESRHDNSDK